MVSRSAHHLLPITEREIVESTARPFVDAILSESVSVIRDLTREKFSETASRFRKQTIVRGDAEKFFQRIKNTVRIFYREKKGREADYHAEKETRLRNGGTEAEDVSESIIRDFILKKLVRVAVQYGEYGPLADKLKEETVEHDKLPSKFILPVAFDSPKLRIAEFFSTSVKKIPIMSQRSKQHIIWPQMAEFTPEVAAEKIHEFIRTWNFSAEWKYFIRLFDVQENGTICKFIFKVTFFTESNFFKMDPYYHEGSEQLLRHILETKQLVIKQLQFPN